MIHFQQRTPIPFDRLKRAIPWDGLWPFDPTNSGVMVGAGNKQVGVSRDELQRWQNRYGEFEIHAKFVDEVGMQPPVEHNYGDLPLPLTDTSTLLRRMLGSMASNHSINLPISLQEILVSCDIDLSGIMPANAGETLFWPNVSLFGQTVYTLAVGPGTELLREWKTSKANDDWEPFGTATVINRIGGSWNVNLFAEPLPAPAGISMVPDIFEVRPRVYKTA